MAAVIGGAVVGAVATGLVNKALAPDAQGATPQSAAAERLTGYQADFARDSGELWRQSYRPVEEALAGEALTAGSEAEQQRMADLAGTDVQVGYKQSRDALNKSLSRRHISTASPAYLAAMSGLQLGEAKSTAGAMNRARVAERQSGFAKRATAAGVGRNAATTANVGLGTAARTMDAIGEGDFYRGEYLQEQARRGLAPVTGAIGDQAGQAAGAWIRQRQQKYKASTNTPTSYKQYENFS